MSHLGHYRDVYRSICDLTVDHFYKSTPRLYPWVSSCRRNASLLPIMTTETQLVSQIQEKMSELQVSHFTVYSPAEDRKLWKGETVDTGIRSRLVDGRLIVHRVLPNSSAASAGVLAGDEVLAFPGSSEAPTAWDCEHRSGVFKFLRRGEELKLNLVPKPLVIDSSPELRALNKHTGLLVVSSFRSEFFERENWLKVVSELSSYKHLVVDIRQNIGGNFVAMLRALSTFMCKQETIGSLLQPRKRLPELKAFEDHMEDQYQLQQLERYGRMGLRTFSDYSCYRGQVTVLTDSQTSSVAEIFADSMKLRPNTRVWGQPTAGDVVLAVWYDLPQLGRGFSVSIPQAVYLNRAGHELEGEGVFPQRDLFYDLESSLRGQDRWLMEATK